MFWAIFSTRDGFKHKGCGAPRCFPSVLFRVISRIHRNRFIGASVPLIYLQHYIFAYLHNVLMLKIITGILHLIIYQVFTQFSALV